MKNEDGLLQKQREIVSAMIRARKPLEEILEEFGVNETDFNGWLLDGQFTDYVMSLARGYAEANIPYIWDVLRQMVNDRSVSAIRLYYDLLNKKTPANGAERPETTDLTDLRGRIFRDPSEETA